MEFLSDMLERPERLSEKMMTDNPPHPSTIVLTATNKCNLRCIMCGIWKDQPSTDAHGRTLLGTDEILSFIKGLQTWGGVRFITFDTIGEPLMNPDFARIVTYAREQGFFVGVASNGTRLDEETARAIIEADLQAMTISIDSAIPEIHDRIRGQKGALAKTCEGIRTTKRLQDELGRSNPALRIMTVLSKLNYQEIDRMADLALDLSIEELRIVYVSIIDDEVAAEMKAMTGNASNVANTFRFDVPKEQLYIEGIDRGELMQSLERLETKCRQHGIDLNLSLNPGMYQRSCKVFWNSMFIDAFGNVYPCAMLNEVTGLGNIRETELDAIWGGERYRKLRTLIDRRNRGEFELPICQRCCHFADIQSV